MRNKLLSPSRNAEAVEPYRSRDGRSIANDADASWLAPAFSEIFRVLRPDSFCVSFYGWSQAARSSPRGAAPGFILPTI